MIAIKMICHSSVVIQAGDAHILCDPWLHGKAFNNSWALLIPSALSEEDLERINYLWVSHEHPDHFHIPSLRSLPDSFKERVTVLFKTDFTKKVPEAFRRLGYPNVRLLPHREIVDLGGGTQVYSFHSRVMDSALGVIRPEGVVLNTNDAELTEADCKKVVKDIGRPDVMLDQFGIAGSSGQPNYDEVLSYLKRTKVANMMMHHRALGTQSTIPFASFVYFCMHDNKHINPYLSTMREVYNAFESAGLRCDALFPGDTWRLGEPWDSTAALEKFDEVYNNMDSLAYDESPVVDLATLESAHGALVEELEGLYPKWLLRRMPPVVVRIPDLEETISFGLGPGSFQRLSEPATPTLTTNSQPLHFAFTNPFGFQTLGVSGRYWVAEKLGAWRYYRVLFSLRNAGVYGRAKRIFQRDFLSYVWSRKEDLPQQAIDRWRTMSYRSDMT